MAKIVVAIDPQFWDDFANAPPDVQRAAREIIAMFHQAAENIGDGGIDEFNAELERLSGSTVTDVVDERLEPTTKH